MTITGATTVCGIVGDPVAHTLSPAMQNAAFEHAGLDYVYVPWRLPRGRAASCVEAVRTLGIRGLNVTVPHKVDILRYLDVVDDRATRIGAVNTIVNQAGRLSGYNTDAEGFLQGLRAGGIDVRGMQVVVMGAGGAARAVVFSLVDGGAQVTILNRDPGRAAELARDVCGGQPPTIGHGLLTADVLEQHLKAAALLVNTTSVGMHPMEGESPCPLALLRRDLAVCDIVYNPRETLLLRGARDLGAVTVDGVEMLVQQGARAFELWTGVKAPVDVMRSVVVRELGRASH
ncbi:MAG: shikimate dehydrogenase [Dehalococcoidia bacterium]|nr:shikimate dehydrogenase [Dehalococcoidia bacterium]